VIVGDIPPLAFEVAARLHVPSVAIANFTWDWIYEWHPPLCDAPGFLDHLRAAYGKATLALRLPFAPVFDQFPRVEDLPLVARVSTQPRDVTRRALDIPPDRRVALLSFGGYGLQRLDVAGLDCLDDWTVLLTDRLSSSAPVSPHVVFVDESRLSTDFRYEDLVAASDVVVTKPGYGVLSECAAAGTALLYTSRGHFREYDLLVQEMPRMLRSRFLSQDALFAGRWKDALEALLQQPAPPTQADVTGAARAAVRIVEVAERGATPGR
jgi:L-arabinokinase